MDAVTRRKKKKQYTSKLSGMQVGKRNGEDTPYFCIVLYYSSIKQEICILLKPRRPPQRNDTSDEVKFDVSQERKNSFLAHQANLPEMSTHCSVNTEDISSLDER